MRRDVCYYFDAPVESVFNAYLSAARNEKFDRTCEVHPYHTISFGLNFSMKFNMNGGSCTLHFIKYGTGTAVDFRFSIVQLFGARYEQYSIELTHDATVVLGVPGRRCEIDINLFLDDRNKVFSSAGTYSDVVFEGAKPFDNSVPTPSDLASCPHCGKAYESGAVFCTGCGKKKGEGTAPDKKFCSKCGAEAGADSSFCSKCGTKL